MNQQIRCRWLVLSHAFNMDGRAASLTVSDKMPFLEKHGIEPIILSAVTGVLDPLYRHEQLLPWGPSALRFDLRHILSRVWGKTLRYRVCVLALTLLLAPFILIERLVTGLSNSWSWSLAAFSRGRAILRHQKIDVVYSSGGSPSAHLAAYWLHLHTGCCWIAEIHDPMVMPGTYPKTREAKFLAWLEGKICQHAHAAWWFTQGALESARRRHPALGSRGFCVLPGANPPLAQGIYVPQNRCVFGHFGSLSSTRSLAPVFRALKSLLTKTPGWRDRVRIEIYGAELDESSKVELSDGLLQDVVFPMGRLEQDPATGMSGRQRVGLRMQEVDVLLLVHGVIPECCEYIPSKIYDYFWSKRPVLALTWRNAQLDQLVLGHEGWVADNSNPAAIEHAISHVLATWQEGALPAPQTAPVTVEQAVTNIVRKAEKHAS